MNKFVIFLVEIHLHFSILFLKTLWRSYQQKWCYNSSGSRALVGVQQHQKANEKTIKKKQ